MKLIKRDWNIVYLTYISLRIVHSLCGYPRFTDRELRNRIYGPKINEREIEYVNHFSWPIRRTNIVYVAFCACCLSINLVFPLYTMIAMNSFQSQSTTSKRTGEDVESTSDAVDVSTFGCLHTNCSKLRREYHFEDDMVLLPVFKLCFPTLQSYYLPNTDLNLFGLIIHTVSYFLVFVFGVIMPLNLYTNPLSHETGVFVFTPNTMHRIHSEVARKYLVDILSSMKCFYYAWKKDLPLTSVDEQQSAIKQQSRQRSFTLLESLISNQLHDEKSYLRAETLQLRSVNEDYSLLNKTVQNYIDDCVPFIRTKHFRFIMARQYWSILTACMLYTGALSVLVIYATHNATLAREQELMSIDRFIRSNGCALWRGTDESIIEYIRLGEPKSRWTLPKLVYYAILVFPLMIIISSLVGASIMAMQELNIEITAQIDRLHLGITMIRLIQEIGSVDETSNRVDLKYRLSNNDSKYNDNDFNLEKLRELHHGNLRFILGFVYLKPLKDQNLTDLAFDQLIEHGTSEDVYLNALIKIYISNRALTRLVKSNCKNITRILGYCYLITFGIVLLVVY